MEIETGGVETVLKKRLPLRELHDLHAEVKFSI
jgi:hypothetical protein